MHKTTAVISTHHSTALPYQHIVRNYDQLLHTTTAASLHSEGFINLGSIPTTEKAIAVNTGYLKLSSTKIEINGHQVSTATKQSLRPYHLKIEKSFRGIRGNSTPTAINTEALPKINEEQRLAS